MTVLLEARALTRRYTLPKPHPLAAAPLLTALEDAYRGADILVVAHGGIVYALERAQGHEHVRLPNLGARWLTHHGEHIELGERVLLVDDDDITTVPAQI